MSIFREALAAARNAVHDTYAEPMTITAMLAGEYRAAVPDPARPALHVVTTVLHEFAARRTAAAGAENAVVERVGEKSFGKAFGFEAETAPTRISLDVAELGDWIPPSGTIFEANDSGRRFEVSHAGPQNGGRMTFFVVEIGTAS